MLFGAYEIVQVLGDAILITSTWCTCRYATCDGLPLSPGFYFVMWPMSVKAPAYDKEARYVGPVTTKMFAEKLKTSALALGLIVPRTAEPLYARNNSGSIEYGRNQSR